MKMIVRTAGVLLALLATSVSPLRAQQMTEVRVAMLAPSALLWLHAIAKDQGFYAECGFRRSRPCIPI